MNRFAITLAAATASASALIVGAPVGAHAMSYSYRATGSDTVVIDASGEIMLDEDKVFGKWAVAALPKDIQHRQHFAFVLNSPGGNPFGAYAFGEAIRKNGGHTGVAQNGMCASACVVLWAAGVKKSVSSTSRIGVHGASFNKDQMSAEEAKNASLYSASTTLEIAQQLHMYGAPDHVVVQTVMTPSNDIYWLTPEDETNWGANIVP